MSVQEVQVEQSQGKYGLKRKLTGPPRLLLGKFRAKTQGDNQPEAQTKGPNGINDSRGPGLGSPENQANMGDDNFPSIGVESFQKLTAKQPEMQSEQDPAVTLEVCSTMNKSEAEREAWDGGSMTKKRAKKRSRRRWLWAPSLACVQRRRRRPREEQASDGPSRDSETGLAGELFVADPTGPSKDPKASISPKQGGAVTEGKGGFSDRTGFSLKRLIASNKSKKPKGVRSEPSVQSGSSGHAKASFREKMGLFCRRGNRYPPTSAEHRITSDKETTELPPPEQEEANIPERDCSEAATTSGGHLTVSVEVSALGQDGTEKGNPVEGGNNADGHGSPVGLRKLAEEYKPRRCSKDELDRLDRRLSKTAGSLPPVMEETPAAEKESDWSPVVGVDSRKDQLREAGASSPLHVARAENDRIPEKVCTEDVMGACLSVNGVALESSVQDPPALNGIDCTGYLSRDAKPVEIEIVVTNGPMGSPLEDLHPRGRSLVNHPYGDLDLRNSEALLMQTASSLVQAAVKAALDQLAAELETAALPGGTNMQMSTLDPSMILFPMP